MLVKEWFKSKPYWLKGGIISLLVMVILVLFHAAIDEFFGVSLIDNIGFIILASPIILISIPLFAILVSLGFLVDSLFNTGNGYTSLQFIPGGEAINLIIAITYFFFIGAFIGLIIGKIKSRKK